MPNWVSNRITITGEQGDIDNFADHIDKRPRMVDKKEWVDNKFSFHSFIEPHESITYEEYHSVNGFENGKKVGDTQGNWYNWNNSNWDTKWDAGETVVVRTSPTTIVVEFNTAWSPPMPVYEEMISQFSKLNFRIWWEEETGFGARYESDNGTLLETQQWGPPESHADYVDRGDEDSCVCSWTEDQSDWYEDCPRAVKMAYEVLVTNRYVVEALTPESAKQAIIDFENNFDMNANSYIKTYPEQPMWFVEAVAKDEE
jgi:hypothetical protein